MFKARRRINNPLFILLGIVDTSLLVVSLSCSLVGGVFGFLGSILGGEEDCQDFNEYATIVTGFEVPAKMRPYWNLLPFFIQESSQRRI